MKFGQTPVPQHLVNDNVIVGNVYAAKGNRPTVAWVVVSVNDTRCCVLGIDQEGQVCSAQTYGTNAMRSRDIIGFCAGVGDMELEIEWAGAPRSFSP